MRLGLGFYGALPETLRSGVAADADELSEAALEGSHRGQHLSEAVPLGVGLREAAAERGGAGTLPLERRDRFGQTRTRRRERRRCNNPEK